MYLNTQGQQCQAEHLADGFFRHVYKWQERANHAKTKTQAQTELALLQQKSHMAQSVLELGLDGYKSKILCLQYKAGYVEDNKRVFYRFNLMIDSLFKLMSHCGNFRLEEFQRELMWGFILGIAPRQFDSDLYKYKHILLCRLGLGNPDIEAYDPDNPSKRISNLIDEVFNRYAKRYTLAIVPRRCGKTTIMKMLLAVAITFLDLDIMVQAHCAGTCTTLYNEVLNMIFAMEKMDWFPAEFVHTNIVGEKENQSFIYNPAVKPGKSTVHFIAAGANVSTARGQNPDLVLIDEAGFINLPALLSVLPLMAINGTKQIHISSPVNHNAWISRVEDIKDADGQQAVHVAVHRFKCKYHADAPGATCSCSDIYCPDHITVNHLLQSLLNLVQPGSFEMELTGAVQSGGRNDLNPRPFTDEICAQFAGFTASLSSVRSKVAGMYVAIDPTFSTGTLSGVGVCSLVRTTDDRFLVILGLDEIKVDDLRELTMKVHLAALLAHIYSFLIMFPTTCKTLPITVVIEQNTFNYDITNLWHQVDAEARKQFGLALQVYSENPGEIGKHTGRNKTSMVLSCAALIKAGRLGRIDTCLSMGSTIRGHFLQKMAALKNEDQAAFVMACNEKTLESSMELPQFQDIPAEAFDSGKTALHSLCVEMISVEIDTERKIPVVITGGKKRGEKGVYTKDDMLAAFIIAVAAAINKVI
nr:DNA packaging terminase subunit 1 [Acipenserid herpesvirus 1]